MFKSSFTLHIISLTLITLFIFPALPSINAQPYTDPVGDIFDKNGKPIQAEDYLDIKSIDVKKTDNYYFIELTLNGKLPSAKLQRNVG